MPTQEPVAPKNGESMTPLEYLARADKEMASGNGREAAGLLWKAAEVTLEELGQKRGYALNGPEYEDFMEIADALESDKSGEKHYFRSNFIAASVLRDHADMEVLEDTELDFSYCLTRKFIVECNDAIG